MQNWTSVFILKRYGAEVFKFILLLSFTKLEICMHKIGTVVNNVTETGS